MLRATRLLSEVVKLEASNNYRTADHPDKGAQTAAATRTPARIKNREHSATEPDGEM